METLFCALKTNTLHGIVALKVITQSCAMCEVVIGGQLRHNVSTVPDVELYCVTCYLAYAPYDNRV